MGRKERAVKPKEMIWEVPDELWMRIEAILLKDAPPPPAVKGGRKRTDWRQAFNRIIFRMRTGCQRLSRNSFFRKLLSAQEERDSLIRRIITRCVSPTHPT